MFDHPAMVCLLCLPALPLVHPSYGLPDLRLFYDVMIAASKMRTSSPFMSARAQQASHPLRLCLLYLPDPSYRKVALEETLHREFYTCEGFLWACSAPPPLHPPCPACSQGGPSAHNSTRTAAPTAGALRPSPAPPSNSATKKEDSGWSLPKLFHRD